MTHSVLRPSNMNVQHLSHISSQLSSSIFQRPTCNCHLQEVAARILAAALFGDVHDSPLQHFQQRLLHALPTHVACDADVLALLHNLVHLRSNTAAKSEHATQSTAKYLFDGRRIPGAHGTPQECSGPMSTSRSHFFANWQTTRARILL